MADSCGIPGCRYPKFTPDGNKSFKCSFWKIKARKKVEEISLRLTANRNLSHLPSEAIPVRSIYENEFFNKENLTEVQLLNEPEAFFQPSLFHEPIPRPTVNSEAELREEVSNLKQIALSDSLATNQIGSIHSVLRKMTTMLLDHLKATEDVPRDIKNIVNYVSTVQDEVLDIRKQNLENSRKVALLEKKVLTLEKKVDERDKSQDNKDDKAVLYDQVPLNKLSFDHIIKFSKYFNRKIDGKNDSRGFVISKDKSLIYYFIKNYPKVFKAIDNIDYSKIIDKQVVRDQIEKNGDFIWILPSMEVNFERFNNSIQNVIVIDDVSSRIFKNYDRMFVDNNLWIEFYIMAKFSNGAEYRFSPIVGSQDVTKYEETLNRFILSNGFKSELDFYQFI